MGWQVWIQTIANDNFKFMVLQMFPRPDVVECCLVLLHLSKTSPMSDALQEQAKDLLQKYGTSPFILKASRRFLTTSGFHLD